MVLAKGDFVPPLPHLTMSGDISDNHRLDLVGRAQECC